MTSNYRVIANILLLQDLTDSKIKRSASVLEDWTATELRDEVYRLLGLLVIQQQIVAGAEPNPEQMDIDLAVRAIAGNSPLDW